MATHDQPSYRSHFLVFVALMVLGAISYGLSFASLSALKVPAALAISMAKVCLVAIFFMELSHQRATNRFVLASAALMVCVLVGLVAADTLTRDTPPLAPAPSHSD